MVFSFSRVDMYATCPKAFRLRYLSTPKLFMESSAFAEWGKLCHSLYEQCATGELEEYELFGEYTNRYSECVTTEFPPNKWVDLGEKYYARGVEIFQEFGGFNPDWETIGAEIKINTVICGFRFVGYIDLLVRDKRDGKLIVVDHKSKAKFKDDGELTHYAYQLYLYAEWVKEKYGDYPKELQFNMFRAGGIVTVPFSVAECDEAKQWFVRTIHAIYADRKFEDRITIAYRAKNKNLKDYRYPDFFCQYICGCRAYCGRSGQS